MLRRALIAGSWAGVACATQPDAVEPVAAPMRDLVWGQLNVLHTTDTHGWLGGHLLEPQYSADWGDYVSLSHHFRQRADDEGVDLLVIDTGDRVEGNGLYDASTPKGLFQYDIYAEHKVDLICIGNHELYQAYSVEKERNTTVPNYKENYIASNLDYVDPDTGEKTPLAQRYRKFKTKNQGFEVLAFGFIFDFTGNAQNAAVQPVEETVKEDWFQEAIKQRPDVFIVTGHVGVRMPEFQTIFKAIRKEDWLTPILFFGGHVHVRDALSYDSKSFAMASGRYLETIGWMSVDGLAKKSKGSDEVAQAAPKFTRKYMDNNLFGMYYHTGLNQTTFPTKHGERVSSMIARARNALDLDYRIGCAPQNLWMSRAQYPGKDSIYSWIVDEVFPSVITNDKRKDKARLGLVNTGGVRFDIFKGPFTKDTIMNISPFVNSFKYVPDVPYKVAQKVLALINSGGRVFEAEGLEPQSLAISEQATTAVRIAAEHEEQAEEEESRQLELRSERRTAPELIGGYTTKDGIGSDGDDTVHEELKFYALPNVVQSEIGFPEDGSKPETVDVVFIDFLQPWIVMALKFSGGDVTNEDVQTYMEGTLASKLAEWVQANWDGDC